MGIILTENARNKIKDIQVQNQLETLPLRLLLKGGGCSGFKYDAYFEENPITETDTVFDCDGQTVIVDMMSLQYLDGTTVDYTDNGLSGAGFQFKTPSAKSTCGCGSSFSV
jgi:iron-sulfur cluster insertion protein